MHFSHRTICFTVAFVCALASSHPSIVAQQKSSYLTEMDIFKLQYAGDPQISPDGRKIVYERRFADIMTDRRESSLWIVNFDGSDDHPFTSGSYNDSSPRWSPDGNRIAYISNRSGSAQIYVCRMDTGKTTQITNMENPPSEIAWSPNGKQISFGALVSTTSPDLAALPQPPPGAKWSDPPKAFDRLFYRYNGQGYLKPGYAQIFVVSADGGTPRRVSPGNFENLGTGLHFRSTVPAWSGDEKYLLTGSNRGPNADVESVETQIYEFSLANGSVRALTEGYGPYGSPTVSPDNDWIAYTGYENRHMYYQNQQLYLMRRDGRASHSLSASLDRDVRSLRWSADSSGIYFLYDDQGDTKLAFYALDGKLRVIASHVGSGSRATPDSPAFSVARNGSFAFTYTDPNHPADIAVGTPGNPSARIVTSVNKNLLAAKRLGQVEKISYKSSVDGRSIDGWIVKPPDFSPSKKYPLILSIHGGPQNNFGDRFDVEMQVWAARGFVVLYTNPRGSDSYGEAFANLMQNAYPGNDFYDLNSGTDVVIAKGYVDPDNLFVTGLSGGAVLTCWVIEHTNRFRAAAPISPATNWTSYILTTDVMPVAIEGFFGNVYPWEDTAGQYSKRSLITSVKAVKTPTLIMTGEEDFRTPISEVEQFYQALKILGVESVMVRVPNDTHMVLQHPSHEIAKMLYIEGWFNQHMKRSSQRAR